MKNSENGIFPLYSHAQKNRGDEKDNKNQVSDKKMSEILPGKLYLGNHLAAQDKVLLQRHGVTHILNITMYVPCAFPEDFQYMHIQMADCNGGIKDHLKKTNAFIAEGKTVFVHCRWGVSRSSSHVIAYLMEENEWSYDRARAFVKEKRTWIHPHATFEEELLAFQQELGIDSEPEKKVDLLQAIFGSH